MSSGAGLLFLLGGLAFVILGILLISIRERATQRPKQTVAGFQRSRKALHKIHRSQVVSRDTRRARARAMHPAGRRSRHRRSA